MLHEAITPDDQVSAVGRPRSSPAGPGGPAGVLLEVQPQGLHAAPTVRRPGPQDVPQDRLPGCRRRPRRLRRVTDRPGVEEGARPLDALLCRTAALKRGGYIALLLRATTSAQDCGLIADRPTAAVDGTGLESRHTSRYFFKR